MTESWHNPPIHYKAINFILCNLCELALDVAQKVLGPNGQFVVKVFQGAGFDEFRKQVVDSFDVLKTAKPAASRARSKEVFLVGQGRKKALQ